MKFNSVVCALILCLASHLPEANASLRHGIKGYRASADKFDKLHGEGHFQRLLKKEDRTDETNGREVDVGKNDEEKGGNEEESVDFSEETKNGKGDSKKDDAGKKGKEKTTEEVATDTENEDITDRFNIVDNNSTTIFDIDEDESESDIEEDFQFADPPAWDRIDEFLSGNLIDVGGDSNETDASATEDAGVSNVVLSDLYDDSTKVFDSSSRTANKTPISNPREEKTGDQVTVEDTVETSGELELRLSEVEIQMETIKSMAASIARLELELEKVMQIISIHGGAITTLADRVNALQTPDHITGFAEP